MAKRKKNKRNRLPFVIFGIVSVLILTVLVGCYLILTKYYNKMNYEGRLNNPSDYILDETVEHTEDVTGGEVTEPSREETPQDELEAFKKEALEAAKNLGIDDLNSDDVTNILLIGSDTRNAGDGGNSDTMMLISINNKTKRIVCTSFLRDLYVYIPHKNFWDKINASFAWGGVNLLLDTIEYNFSLKIDQYIMVDFFSFVNVVDIIGGLDVEVKEEELYWCNQYIHASNLLLKEDEFSDYLEYADGTPQHLSGKQVLAYSRFRYVGNADFSRTERQRYVMNLIFEKIKSSDFNTLKKLLDAFLPEITTNLTQDDFFKLLYIVPDMSEYEIVSWGIPDQAFKYITVNGQSSIGIDFAFYIKKLYGLIYTEKTMEDYQKEG